jgi:hypothetical protein
VQRIERDEGATGDAEFGKQRLYRPRLLGHQVEAYAAIAAD